MPIRRRVPARRRLAKYMVVEGVKFSLPRLNGRGGVGQMAPGEGEIAAIAVQLDVAFATASGGQGAVQPDPQSCPRGRDFGIAGEALHDGTGPLGDVPGLAIPAVIEVHTDEAELWCQHQADPIDVATPVALQGFLE